MKRNSPSLSIFLLLMALGLATSCAKKPDDAKISSEIQNRFSQDSGLSGKQLTVQSSNGTVTLAGNVDNDAQRDAASKQAASVEGVKQVINNLEVGNAAQAPAATPVAQNEAPAPVPEQKPEPARKSHKSRHHEEMSQQDNSGPGNSNQQMADNNPPPQASDQQQATPAPAPAPEPPPPPKKYIIDQGTQVSIRLIDSIDSEKNQTGDTFHATLNTPLTSDGEEAVPAGADVTGHLVEVKSAGKFAGQSEVVAQLDSITVGGRTYNIQTDQYRKQAASRGKNTAEKVGGGALIGGIIGALAGGGKGAAIGAAAGGGVGGGVQAASKSQQIKLPSETVLNFTLQAPVTVVKAPNPNADRPKLNQ